MTANDAGMLVVVVEFRIVADRRDQFLMAIDANASRSLELEQGCRQFDVCVDSADAQLVFLYEVYESDRSFQDHVASSHYQAFDAETRDWVTSKVVRKLTLRPAQHAVA